MKPSPDREYYDLELKHQSKRRLAALQQAIDEYGVVVHNQYETKYFSGKQAWRNPLVLRVSIPAGQRWKIIRAVQLPLYRIPQIGVPTLLTAPTLRLRGNHDSLEIGIRRSYRFPDGAGNCWIKNYDTTKPPSERSGCYELIEGVEALQAVLDGDLDRVLRVDP